MRIPTPREMIKDSIKEKLGNAAEKLTNIGRNESENGTRTETNFQTAVDSTNAEFLTKYEDECPVLSQFASLIRTSTQRINNFAANSETFANKTLANYNDNNKVVTAKTGEAAPTNVADLKAARIQGRELLSEIDVLLMDKSNIPGNILNFDPSTPVTRSEAEFLKNLGPEFGAQYSDGTPGYTKDAIAKLTAQRDELKAQWEAAQTHPAPTESAPPAEGTPETLSENDASSPKAPAELTHVQQEALARALQGKTAEDTQKVLDTLGQGEPTPPVTSMAGAAAAPADTPAPTVKTAPTTAGTSTTATAAQPEEDVVARIPGVPVETAPATAGTTTGAQTHTPYASARIDDSNS